MNFKPALLAAASLIAMSAHGADIVAQWGFDAASTKQDISQNGASFAALGVTVTFAAGSAGGQALNTAGYAAQGTGNMTRGVQFMIDTSGNENLLFSFDQRNSSTASAYTALLYTLDAGASWIGATTLHYLPTTASFVKGISYDFSSIIGANNNTDFGVRLVNSFAPGTTTYTGSGGSYSANGTIRYDMVTLSGTAIPDTAPVPVPEASSMAMLLSGLGVVGLLVRRRRIVA